MWNWQGRREGNEPCRPPSAHCRLPKATGAEREKKKKGKETMAIGTELISHNQSLCFSEVCVQELLLLLYLHCRPYSFFFASLHFVIVEAKLQKVSSPLSPSLFSSLFSIRPTHPNAVVLLSFARRSRQVGLWL